MDRIRKARAPVRAAVTRTIVSIEAELAKDDSAAAQLEVYNRVLEKNYKKLSELDDQVTDAMLDADVDANDLEAENVSVQEYSEKIEMAKVKIDKVIRPPKSPSPSAESFASASEASARRKTFKLPKIELKKFSGELTDWLGWWAQFQKIDEDEALHASDKFQYLVQCMVPGTRARDLVDSYPQSKENYPKAVAGLKERFGKAKLLKQVYVRELIKMIVLKSQEKWKLSSLFDKLESHLRSLDSLGVTAEQMSEFLFPMVESCLPEDILIAWQRSPFYGKDGSADDPPKIELDFLMEFLKKEIESEGQRSLAMAGFGLMSLGEKKRGSFVKRVFTEEDTPTAAGLFSGEAKKHSCIFCDRQHESASCFKAQVMSLQDKKAKIQEKKACFNCFFPGHQFKNCKKSVKCGTCGKRHQTLLCPDQSSNKSGNPPKTTVSTLNCTNEVILQSFMVFVKNPETGSKKLVRAMIDNGSQRSYILKKTAEDLDLKSQKEVILNHSLFGGSQLVGKTHNKYTVILQSTRGKYSTDCKVLDQVQICATISRVAKGPWMSELKRKKIFVNDLDTENSLEVEMLIGSDFLGQILTGKSLYLSNGLTATETQFCWTLMGEIGQKESSIAMSVISMSLTSANVSDLWRLETIGIMDPVESKTRQEKELAAKKYFMETVKRNPDGRYSVKLPWIEGFENIPDNKAIAEKRLAAATNKLNSLGKYTDYEDILLAWKADGIISDCFVSTERCHYLPHRAVLKPQSKTTPVRPEFDASCKNGRSPSLNDCLERGPNLLELIPSILVRFRVGRIGVISDIKKAFLMIEVNEVDRDYLRFLWWENRQENKLKMFRHNRVVFGMNCSPFLLGAVIGYHLENVTDSRRAVALKLMKSLYVDNCVTSIGSHAEYELFKSISTALMAEAKMELRQWECSFDISGEDTTSVLGLRWDKIEDSLFCESVSGEIPEKITKRVILSHVQKIFDPLGFLCPAVMTPKLILQKLWSEKDGWDEDIPPEMKMQFQKWWMEMSEVLTKLRIPRNCTGGGTLEGNCQIHTFCDASKDAYAAVVFLRVKVGEEVSVQLIHAKSRVAPMKLTTIPRLELLSCNIAARLAHSALEALVIPEVPTFFWSDSSTALAWIRRNDDWGTFVGNRVREICKLTDATHWRHVPGSKNPADLPSRGCSPLKLLEHKWWEGPDWLKQSRDKWPSEDEAPDEELVLQERRKSIVLGMTNIDRKEKPWWLLGYSSYLKNVRVIALVMRFVNKLRKKSSFRGRRPSKEEVDEAELKIFLWTQAGVFHTSGNVICGLNVLRDEEGIIRVVTKLVHRQDSYGFRYPVLLPFDHPIVKLLVRETHITNGHAGIQFVMGKLRENVWIVQGRRAIRKVIKSCVTCRRFAAKSPKVPPAALPENRVKDVKAFEVTGIDMAGPLLLKDKSKVWVVIFTCSVYRCVHLELAQSINTEDFLMAFTRFCKRKRRPTTVYTDNGTNFGGSVTLFKKIDWNEVERRTQLQRINWRFNPPTAAWWGGWWERLIRSMKDSLKRMLGFGKLTYVQLETALCEVEYVMNNRPLTFVTEDQDDLIPLTPAMFIHDLPESDCPEAEVVSLRGFGVKYKNMKQLMDELQSRFRKEYLVQLVQRGKELKIHKFRVGDVVLMGADNRKRIDWPMARVLELLPGADGKHRVARVKTASGVFTRPLQRLYPLEVSSPEDVPKVTPEVVNIVQKKELRPVVEVKTRSGRQVKAPTRYTDH